jgi:hypothetical protein
VIKDGVTNHFSLLGLSASLEFFRVEECLNLVEVANIRLRHLHHSLLVVLHGHLVRETKSRWLWHRWWLDELLLRWHRVSKRHAILVMQLRISRLLLLVEKRLRWVRHRTWVSVEVLVRIASILGLVLLVSLLVRLLVHVVNSILLLVAILVSIVASIVAISVVLIVVVVVAIHVLGELLHHEANTGEDLVQGHVRVRKFG